MPIALASLLLLSPSTARAACPEAVDAARFDAQLALADARFAAMDGDVFAAAMDEASFMVPCLGEGIGPDLASRYHRLQGLRLFMSRNEERAMQAFGAARAADRKAELSLELVPEGHAIRDLWAAADPSGPSIRVPPPVSGTLGFDGLPSDRRPQSRPTLVQVISGEGRALASAWIEPGDPLPPYEARPLPLVAEERRPMGLRTPLLIGGGAAALVSGVLYGVAASQAASFDAPTPPGATLDDLRGAQRSTNRLVVGSAVAGGLSAATVATAVVAGRW